MQTNNGSQVSLEKGGQAEKVISKMFQPDLNMNLIQQFFPSSPLQLHKPKQPGSLSLKSIPAGDNILLVSVVDSFKDSDLHNSICALLEKIEIIIEYESSYEEEFKLKE